MAFIAKASIQEVLDKIDALAVVGDYVRLQNRGGRYLGLCPFHNEKTPSFSVNPDKKLYYCFGCHKGGTVLNFLMEMDKLSFPEAVETLARRFAVPLVYENSGPLDEEAAKKSGELFELCRRCAGTFRHILLEKEEGKAARDYLLSRGVSVEMIEKFRLGYAPRDRRWLHRFLLGKGYSAPFLASSGLFSPKYPEISFFSGRLIFPIADRQGRITAFGGRILPGAAGDGKEEGPKYLNSRESDFFKKGQTLFAVDLAQGEIKKTREAILAEGYMDVIALHQAGLGNAVAPLGTSFTDEQAKLLRRWAERVRLFLDADEAGQAAVEKAILTCRRNGLEALVARPPGEKPAPGEAVPKDPAEILQKFGPEALQRAVKSCILDFDYLINRGRKRLDRPGPGGKAEAVAFLFPYAETLDSEVSRETCLASLADAFGVDRGAVLGDYRRFERSRKHETRFESGDPGGNRRGEGFSQKSRPIRLNDELFLLVAVSVNQALYPGFRAALSIKEIEDPAAKELFVALEECFIHDETGMDALLPRISSEELRNFLVERGSSREFSANPERIVPDGIRKLKRRRLERRLEAIVARMRVLSAGAGGLAAPSGGPEEDGVEELLAEKMNIDAELRRLKEDNP
jgi:DNA primase